MSRDNRPNPNTLLTDPVTGAAATFLTSAFGHTGRVTFATIRDGTGNTAVVSEIIQGAENDQRGMVWSSLMGGGSFTSRFAPNQFRDYYQRENDANRLYEAAFCVNDPPGRLPCIPAVGNDRLRTFAGAKSRHPGGVNALFGDGSVRFLKDSINHSIWIGVNTIRGDEVISADQY